MPDFQEYHALRRVRDAKVLCNRLADDPDDTIAAVDNERDRIPVLAFYLPIHQEILELPAPGSPEGPEPVTRTAAADGKRQRQRPGRDAYFRATALPPSWTPRRPGWPLEHLGAHRLGAEVDLARNRQRKRKRVSPFALRATVDKPAFVRPRRYVATARLLRRP
jgi:hypothetical protein